MAPKLLTLQPRKVSPENFGRFLETCPWGGALLVGCPRLTQIQGVLGITVQPCGGGGRGLCASAWQKTGTSCPPRLENP